MNENEPKQEIKKLTENEATSLLVNFLEQNGIKKDEIQIFGSRYFESQKGGRWEFEVEFGAVNPSGLFIVYANERVEDNYGVLNKR